LPRSLGFTDRAVADFEAVRAWYTQPGAGSVAKKRLLRITLAIEGLPRFPCFYKAGASPGTRVMICDRHRVIDQLDPDTGDNMTAGDVTVLRILGPGMP
jgi:plasmid stabilization system protein ParE